mgnify:FL=1
MVQIMDHSQVLLFLQEQPQEQLRLHQQMTVSMKEMKLLLYRSQQFQVLMLQRVEINQ